MSQIKNNQIFLGSQRKEEVRPDGLTSDESEEPKKISPAAYTAAGEYDPKVETKRKNREHILEDKLRLVKEVLSAPKGQVSAILRREGLYWSQIKTWCSKYEKHGVDGLTGAVKKNATKSRNLDKKEYEKLERENIRLKKELDFAKKINEIQKKISEILNEENQTGSAS